MKKILLYIIACFASLTFVQAQKNDVSYSKLDNVFNLNVKNSSEKLSLVIKGDVSIADDDKSISAISGGGYIAYRKKDQSLNISADESGNISYKINGNNKTSLSEDDKKLIADCVKEMIDYGVDADNRVKRIYAQKGSAGVLDEVTRFKSDYVKEMYLSYLLKDQKLSKDEMIALLNKTDEYLTSDYYKAELLDGVMNSFLADEATSDAYLKTVNNIRSDYYQSTAVQKLLSAPLNEKQYNQVLSIVTNMKSDYYQCEVLKTLLKNNNISDEKFSGIIKIVTGMKSDYYQAEIVNMLLKNKSIDKSRYSQAITVMQSIKSDYYQYSILANLIDENIKDEADWSKLIQYAGNLGSDYYQAEALMKIAEKMPASSSLKEEFKAAAKKIRSDYYYGMVIRAIDKSA